MKYHLILAAAARLAATLKRFATRIRENRR